MTRYRVEAPMGAEIPAGMVLALSKDQAARRRASLKEIEGEPGLFEVVKPVMFKRGETIGVEGKISKRDLASFLPLASLSEAPDLAADLKAAAAAAKAAGEPDPATPAAAEADSAAPAAAKPKGKAKAAAKPKGKRKAEPDPAPAAEPEADEVAPAADVLI